MKSWASRLNDFFDAIEAIQPDLKKYRSMAKVIREGYLEFDNPKITDWLKARFPQEWALFIAGSTIWYADTPRPDSPFDRLMARISPNIRLATLESCENAHGADITSPMQAWLDLPVQCVFMYGNPGTGKSCAAVALVKAYHQMTHGDICFTTAIMLDSELLQASKSDDGDARLLKKLCDYGLLVIDDFGRENTTERTKRQFFQIIDHRYSWRLPTILTSNLSLKEIGQRYDAAITSRMHEWIFIHFAGKDFRKEGFNTQPIKQEKSQ